ncbi:MAG: hypothetical protein AB1500_10835 [Bacillota bacterium]
MARNEELFVKLCLMHRVGSPETKELIEKGFLTSDHCLTQKGEEEVKKFVKAYKEPLYQAMKKYYSDNRTVMRKVGLENYVAFLFVMEELYNEGLLIKDEKGEYRLK